MADKPIKNIIFDFGGVVVGYDPAGYVKGVFGDAPAARYVLDNFFGNAVIASLDLGLMSREEAYGPIMAKARADGYGAELAYVEDHWFEAMMGTKEDTAALIGALKRAGYSVYYLTNMPKDLWARFCDRGLKDLFDGGVASFELHITKPDRRIYEALFARTGIDPAESVFLDDMERNLRGAEAVGLRTVLFTGAQAARRALIEMGVRLDA